MAKTKKESTTSKPKSKTNTKSVAQYKNELNTVSMRGWSSDEMDFFFAICSKAKNKGTDILYFSRAEIEAIVHPDTRVKSRMIKTFDNLANHVSKLRYFSKTNTSIGYWTLFPVFQFEWNEDMTDYKAKVAVNPDFDYILNNLGENFTKFPMREFIQLDSTYAKTLYRQLKQYRLAGNRTFSAEEFIEVLGFPESYRQYDIDRKMQKVIKELEPYFANLKMEKTYSKYKTGKPIKSYIFTWNPEESTGEYKENKFADKKASTKAKKSDGKQSKKGKKPLDQKAPPLPDWYANTGSDEKPSPELLAQAEAFQEKLRREEAERQRKMEQKLAEANQPYLPI